MAESMIEETLNLQAGNVELEGTLLVPPQAKGIVIFSHGSGSSRHSPRNRHVANMLEKNRYGSLLFDLLTEEEAEDYSTRFDMELITERLISAYRWLKKQQEIGDVDISFFGASTGAASALKAAARLENAVKTVISRGGRPDLAKDELEQVACPVLLIVGERDEMTLGINQEAAKLIRRQKLEVVEGASHLFEEPGKLDKAGEAAIKWLDEHKTKT